MRCVRRLQSWQEHLWRGRAAILCRDTKRIASPQLVFSWDQSQGTRSRLIESDGRRRRLSKSVRSCTTSNWDSSFEINCPPHIRCEFTAEKTCCYKQIHLHIYLNAPLTVVSVERTALGPVHNNLNRICRTWATFPCLHSIRCHTEHQFRPLTGLIDTGADFHLRNFSISAIISSRTRTDWTMSSSISRLRYAFSISSVFRGPNSILSLPDMVSRLYGKMWLIEFWLNSLI